MLYCDCVLVSASEANLVSIVIGPRRKMTLLTDPLLINSMRVWTVPIESRVRTEVKVRKSLDLGERRLSTHGSRADLT